MPSNIPGESDRPDRQDEITITTTTTSSHDNPGHADDDDDAPVQLGPGSSHPIDLAPSINSSNHHHHHHHHLLLHQRQHHLPRPTSSTRGARGDPSDPRTHTTSIRLAGTTGNGLRTTGTIDHGSYRPYHPRTQLQQGRGGPRVSRQSGQGASLTASIVERGRPPPARTNDDNITGDVNVDVNPDGQIGIMADRPRDESSASSMQSRIRTHLAAIHLGADLEGAGEGMIGGAVQQGSGEVNADGAGPGPATGSHSHSHPVDSGPGMARSFIQLPPSSTVTRGQSSNLRGSGNPDQDPNATSTSTSTSTTMPGTIFVGPNEETTHYLVNLAGPTTEDPTGRADFIHRLETRNALDEFDAALHRFMPPEPNSAAAASSSSSSSLTNNPGIRFGNGAIRSRRRQIASPISLPRLMFGGIPAEPTQSTTTSTAERFTEGDQTDEAVQRIEVAHREAYDLLLNRIRTRSAVPLGEDQGLGEEGEDPMTLALRNPFRTVWVGSRPGDDDDDVDEDEDEDEEDEDEEEEDEDAPDDEQDRREEQDDDETSLGHNHVQIGAVPTPYVGQALPEGMVEIWGPPAPGSNENTRFTIFRPAIVGGNPQMRIVQPTILSVNGQSDLGPDVSAIPSSSTGTEIVPTAGRQLSRTKSVKRRKLDPSAKNAYTWIPSSMTHPISRIPPSKLPEYMRFSTLPIRAIPTSLNRADCAARLLLTPDLSAPPPNVPLQDPLLAVCYVGTGERGDPDASAVRANHPIPSTCGVYYYEVEIGSKGRDGYISIGFCSRWTDLNRLVGWERESWAWHMDDGYIFESRGEGINRGWPTSTTGDIIGCGIDFTTGKAFFTKNSRFIGEAFGSLQDKGRLYPAVGLRTPGEKLLVNFTGPFRYDIVSHVQRTRDRVQAEVKASPVYMHLPRPVTRAQATEDVEMQTGTRAGGNSTPTAQQSSEDKVTSAKITSDGTRTTLADQVHTCDDCTEALVTRRKPIRDIDTSLTSSVLEYLKGAGYFEAAKGMEKVLHRRRTDDTESTGPTAGGDDEDMDKVHWEETSEEEKMWTRLKSCRDAYARGDIQQVASHLLSCSPTSADPVALVDPGFLAEYKRGIWAFRCRLQHFYSLFRREGHEEQDDPRPSDETFEFFYGKEHQQGFKPKDRLTRLLAAGQHIHAEHAGSTEKEVQEGLNVFALMAYEDVSAAPRELTVKMDERVRRLEAQELFSDVRVYLGHPGVSRIERAYRQTSHTLLELGVLYGSAEAAFLEVPK